MPTTAPLPLETYQGVWVLGERDAVNPNALSDGTLEALTAAQKLGAEITLILLGGADMQALADGAAQEGLKVILLQHDLLSTYQGELAAKAFSDLILANHPNIILTGASATSRDIMPRAAIRTGGGLITDCVDLVLSGTQLEATRPILGESLYTQVISPGARPQMATIRAKAFSKAVLSGAGQSVETVTPDLSADIAHSKRLEVIQPEGGTGQQLEAAKVVVAGGRGLKNAENYAVLEELASLLGGAVGSTRAVVDAGWRPYAEQIGQTGKTVSPKLYFALGISGAMQHLVGMTASGTIVAINKSEDAPIFSVADFGIVGDVLQIVPLLNQALQVRQLGPTF